MATKFQRDEIWYIRFKEAGRWKQLSCGSQAKEKDAEIIRKKYDAQELNTRHQMDVVLVETTLLDQIKQYRDYEIPRSNNGRPKSRGTVIRYQQVIDNFLGYVSAHGWQKFSEITPDRMGNFIEYLYSEGQSPVSVVMSRLELIKFFKWAIQKHFTSTNPLDQIKNPKIEKKPPRFFTEDECSDIFNDAQGVYKNIFKFLYYTGIRIGELGNMEWIHFNVHLNFLRIPVMEGNKRKREIMIPLNSHAVEILNDQKRNIPTINTPDSKKYIFVNNEGNKLDNANIYRNLKIVLSHCKISGASPHTFRHTFASHLAIKGISLYVIKELLGHASIEETEIYSHLSNEAMKNAVQSLSLPEPTLNLAQFKTKRLA